MIMATVAGSLMDAGWILKRAYQELFTENLSIMLIVTGFDRHCRKPLFSVSV